MTLESAEKVADALDALTAAETDDERREAAKAFVVAEREHLERLGVETAHTTPGPVATILPIALLAVLAVLAFIGVGTARKTNELAKDATALAEGNRAGVCASANNVTLAYRVRGQQPDGSLEPLEHFADRMRGQRVALRLATGRQCGTIQGLHGFATRRKAALFEIHDVLQGIRHTAAGADTASPGDKPSHTTGASAPAPPSPGSVAAPSASPPTATTPAQTTTIEQTTTTTETGPQGQPGSPGQPGPPGNDGPPAPAPPAPQTPLDTVCTTLGVCINP